MRETIGWERTLFLADLLSPTRERILFHAHLLSPPRERIQVRGEVEFIFDLMILSLILTLT